MTRTIFIVFDKNEINVVLFAEILWAAYAAENRDRTKMLRGAIQTEEKSHKDQVVTASKPSKPLLT